MCSFAIATTGFQATKVNIGELFIVYDIELFMPQQLPVGSTALAAEYTMKDLSVVNNQGVSTTVGLMGGIQPSATARNKIYDNIGLIFGSSNSSSTMYIGVNRQRDIPSGTVFLFQYIVNGASTATLGRPNVSAVTSSVILGNANSLYIGSPETAATSKQSSISWIVQIPDNSKLESNSLIFWETLKPGLALTGLTNTGVSGATTTVPTGITDATLKVFMINPLLVNGSPAFYP